MGVVLAVNATYNDEYTDAGVCLAAAALAIGILSHTFIRKLGRLGTVDSESETEGRPDKPIRLFNLWLLLRKPFCYSANFRWVKAAKANGESGPVSVMACPYASEIAETNEGTTVGSRLMASVATEIAGAKLATAPNTMPGQFISCIRVTISSRDSVGSAGESGVSGRSPTR
ncbi:MAG: hypothetical protein CL696_12955 [Chloroflexi bacterium]|jgi:hypothetical protein|nr:hypothetical protein [Chloroflexota bacterium]